MRKTTQTTPIIKNKTNNKNKSRGVKSQSKRSQQGKRQGARTDWGCHSIFFLNQGRRSGGLLACKCARQSRVAAAPQTRQSPETQKNVSQNPSRFCMIFCIVFSMVLGVHFALKIEPSSHLKIITFRDAVLVCFWVPLGVLRVIKTWYKNDTKN